MAINSRTSKLEAINTMLTSVGESPVNTLTNPGVDVQIAINILEEVDRETQNIGWFFNRGQRSFTPSSDNTITMPSDILRFYGIKGTQYTLKSGKLFDFENNTNEFTSSVTLIVVEMQDFDDLPEAAKRFITLRASRIYADRVLGDGGTSSFTRQDENSAWQGLRKEQLATSQSDVFGARNRRIINRDNSLDNINRF